MISQEIKKFVLEFFLAPQTKEVVEKAKKYNQLVLSKKIGLNETIASNLSFMASDWSKVCKT